MSKKTQDTKPELAVPTDAVLSVDKLSIITGNRIKMNGHNPHNQTGPGPMHLAADMLHGWGWHLYHYAKPVELSKKDYLAAIKAAGSFKRHPDAIAPNFKPPTKE